MGAVGGFVIGFALKKITKLFIVIIGLFLLALLYMSIYGVININYGALWTTVASVLGVAGAAASWIIGIVSVLPFAGSFAVGFLLDLKIG